MDMRRIAAVAIVRFRRAAARFGRAIGVSSAGMFGAGWGTRCLRVRERHPVAEGEEPDALGHARVEARSGLRYSRSEEPAIEPAIDRERHPGDVAGRVAR
ncbi:MAG TPA: hypothetical protein VNT27_00150, partial [Propionibacteriaceae bacterium]|nr:hypothetical protein [Propionibacteriaceae bacterium]